MKQKLTTNALAALKPRARRYEVRDTLLPGFGVRVSDGGRVSYFVVGRVDGAQVRHTIGRYPMIGLAEARDKAREVMRLMDLGEYNAKKQVEHTLGSIIPMFVERYCRPKNKTWREAEPILRNFEALYDKPLTELRRGDVAQVLDEIVARGSPYQANRALATIKKLCAWALDRGYIEVHPIAGLKPPAKERSRDRVLSKEEIAALWRDCDEQGYPFGPFMQVLLATGQRRGEVAEMRYSEIDFDTRTWKIPAERAKNGKPHFVPLAPMVIDLLTRLPRFAGSDLVFTTTGETAISGFGHYKLRLDQRLGFAEPWRPHDLRRTAASGMAEIGVAPHVIEKVLNHISGTISGVAAVYNRHAYDAEKREALERWAIFLSLLIYQDQSFGNDSSGTPKATGSG